MSEYTPTIGLEIHAQLKTQTKMFCNSLNDPDEKEPNVNICPICTAQPGTLPVINKKAVEYVLKVGTAVGGEVADYTEFDRKNYFYPDIPKGYQISQYKYPLIKGGAIGEIEITRIHLEEDTGRSIHSSALKVKVASDAGPSSAVEEDFSLVDYNRAGVPLMELVTEPVIHTPEEAGNFAREFQLLLRSLGVAEANMEKGEMRVEANISVSKTDELGTKTEVKNINSFRAVEKAIAYEIERQVRLLENGEGVVQETRGWDDANGVTFSQREKEESHDYRYFPDPDLPKLKLSLLEEFEVGKLKESLPELPWEIRGRFKNEFGIKDEDIESYLRDDKLRTLFEETIAGFADKGKIQLASNYITSDLQGLIKNDPAVYLESHLPHGHKVNPENLHELIEMAFAGELSSRGAKNTLAILYSKGGSARAVAEENSLLQSSSTEDLKVVVEEVMAENPEVAEQLRKGDEKVLKFLVGQGMKKTGGSANPQILSEIFESILKKNS